ncbi:hypothetical protein HPB48_024439 [Haemaphysalis longicornis]|uniref:Cytochrome P450 n=1 Tax=Haemaphysalis longicornis TaxID=44386 RepID=A0A9J6GY30_HAELO|nr:hypothetical protein HPB48_024439 [Haemaphysalis longicornis]
MLSQWRQKYGTKFGIYFGGEPFLVIGDPEMVHECFVKKSAIFLDRVTGFVDTEPFKSSLFQLNGKLEQWAASPSASERLFGIG